MVTDSMPGDSQELRRRFLVLHDSMPGGTGYLEHLADAAVLHRVLTLAQTALRDCPCQKRSSARPATAVFSPSYPAANIRTSRCASRRNSWTRFSRTGRSKRSTLSLAYASTSSSTASWRTGSSAPSSPGAAETRRTDRSPPRPARAEWSTNSVSPAVMRPRAGACGTTYG
ncbi:DUF1998 domain-containing protein [Streptomyces sp. JJ66]|uniref:DUF1998 domain-containing protein n=1 Tax=Streptomyces sp. JJ66 TaxID=2803843 RepID=UPI0027E28BA9|nr:DUF1998 domain-containing protein [Streptomyces sp. JJ66]